MRNTSATSSALLIKHFMEAPSFHPGWQDVVGLLEPVGRDRHTETSRRVEIDRAPVPRDAPEGDRGWVPAPENLGDQEAGLPAVLGIVGPHRQDGTGPDLRR